RANQCNLQSSMRRRAAARFRNLERGRVLTCRRGRGSNGGRSQEGAMNSLGNSPASRDVANLLHPFTNLATHPSTGPHILARGQGVYVYDDAGREYIEGLAGLWCASLGFGEAELVKAAVRQ